MALFNYFGFFFEPVPMLSKSCTPHILPTSDKSWWNEIALFLAGAATAGYSNNNSNNSSNNNNTTALPGPDIVSVLYSFLSLPLLLLFSENSARTGGGSLEGNHLNRFQTKGHFGSKVA